MSEMTKAKTRDSNMLLATNSYVDKIKKFADEMKLEFTNYQKTCVVNAVRKINPLLESQNITWQNLKVDNILTVLQQTAFLKLNPSAVPNECYYITRKYYNRETKKYDYVLEFGVEGAGNDVILRNFGQDVKEIKSYIVYEGDEFTEGFMDGWDMTLPKHRRTFETHKPIKAVYLIKKNNGEIDVQYADTEDVKKSLLANAKQNGADDKLLRQLNKLDLYDILENEKWLDYEITKKKYNSSDTYTTPLFNPSYTSPISQANMIERKLRNHATRKYPKNFNADALSNLYQDTFDEKYDDKGNIITAEEKLQLTNSEFDENASSESVNETVEDDNRPTIDEEETVEEEQQEETIEIDDNGEVIEHEEEQVVEKEKETPEEESQQSEKANSGSDDEWWK